MKELLRFGLLARRLGAYRDLSRGQILEAQDTRLRALLNHARRNSSFYAERFAGLDLNHVALERIPTLTKTQMMDHFDEIVVDPNVRLNQLQAFMKDPANLGKLYLDRFAPLHTAGTRGRPAIVLQTKEGVTIAFAAQIARGTTKPKRRSNWLRFLREPLRVALVTQRPGFYPSGAAMAYLPAELHQFFTPLQLSVFDPIGETVERLNQFKPRYLVGYAEHLGLLAAEQEAGRLRLGVGTPLRQISNLGEPLFAPTRERIERAFDVHVIDQYSMGECQYLSCGCPLGPGAHLNADLAIMEVVDKDYRHVAPGKPGTRVLITDLCNETQPLIRYEIDDVVTLSPTPCQCGSPMPLIIRVDGREADRFWVTKGDVRRELPYYAFLVALGGAGSVAEHQVLQTGENRFVVRCIPAAGTHFDPVEVRSLIEKRLELEGMSGLIQMEIVPTNRILEEPGSGKVRRAINLMGQTEEKRQQLLQPERPTTLEHSSY